MKAIFALSFCSLALMAQADLKSDTAPTYKKIDAAFMKKDIKAFESATRPLMAKDFKFFDQGKPMTYDQMIANLKDTFAMMSTVKSASVHMVTSKEMGKKATSACEHNIDGTMMGPDNKPHSVTMTGTSNETWVREGKTWKMTSMKWVKQAMTMDGKPFDLTKMSAPPKANPMKKKGH